MKRNVPKEAIDFLEGRMEITQEQFVEWFVNKANPYYTRAIQRRMELIGILKLAKSHGCECYVTPGDDAYDYGFIIFPKELIKELNEPCAIDTIMYIQNGDFCGYDFTIEYIPSRENGTGCRCNEESVTSVDWNELLHQLKEGFEFASKLKAHMYVSADDFKTKHWGFDKMVKL